MFKRPQLKEQPIFRAITRVPTIAGVTYSYWGMMMLVSTSGIVILKSFTWFFIFLAVCYLIGRMISRYDIFFMNIIMTRLAECARVQNDTFWGCKSYEPW